jgi:nucleoside phosphorylase
MNNEPKIGIVCATIRETLLIVNPRQLGMKQIEKTPFRIYEGGDLAMIMTGMRQSCATFGIEYLLNKFPSIEDVINIGVAGSLNSALPIGSVVLAESAQSYDQDGEEVIRLADSLTKLRDDSELELSRVLTGNRYVSLKDGILELDRLKGLGDVVDMEAFWTVKGCETHGVIPHVIKGISDWIYHPDPDLQLSHFSEKANFAARNAKPILRKIIDIIRN